MSPLGLVAYVVALLVAVLVGLRIKKVRGAGQTTPLSHEEIGYLIGGPRRAAEVAVAALVSENKAKHAGNQVIAVEPAEPAGSPLGTVVQQCLGRRLDDILDHAANSDAARMLGYQLLTRKLLVPPRQRMRRAAAAVLPALLLGALLVITADWTAWTVGAGVLTLAAVAGLLVTPPPVLTTSGSGALRTATSGLAPVEPAELVARYGLRRPAPAPTRRREVVQTAVFDGHTVERIDASEASNEVLPRPRRSAVSHDAPPPTRIVWAAGWFAGGWLASSWLSEVGDGDIFDAGYDGFGDA